MAARKTPKKATPTRRARRPKKADWPPAFLVALAGSPNVTAAAAAAGVNRALVYQRRAADPGFAAAWDDALEQATDDLVGHAFRAAKGGDTALTIFLLKSHRPATYRETVRQEVSGPGGGPIPVALADVPDDDLAALESIALRVAAPRPPGGAAGDPGGAGPPEPR